MSNIRQVQWNEGAPENLQPGMLVEIWTGSIRLIGHLDKDAMTRNSHYQEWMDDIVRWAWLIKPHELSWLENMANRGKVSSRGE